MSEQNLLNASAADLLNPYYGYREGWDETDDVFQAQSGRTYSRIGHQRGHRFGLQWTRVLQSNADALRQWERQYKRDFFTLGDYERSRYYTGRFDGPLQFTTEGFNMWTVAGTFVELPGLAMFGYPANWARDAVFLDERDGYGSDLFKQTGVWTYGADVNAHGGAQLTYPNADTTGIAELTYFGYGCRIHAKKANNLGIFNAQVVRVRDGSVVAGPTAVDQYSAGTVAAAALFTAASLGLDLYRVQILATNTKNASSAAKTICADAVECMQ